MRGLIEALQAGWKRGPGGLLFNDGEVTATITPSRVTKLVPTPVRGDAAWREVWSNLTNDGEIFADGPRSEAADFEKDFASWKRQGWYPRATMVNGARLVMTYEPTDKTFMAEFETEAEAVAKAGEAIPKLRARRRPSWLQIYEATLSTSIAVIPKPFGMIGPAGFEAPRRWRKRKQKPVEEGISYDVGTVRRRKRGEFIKTDGSPPTWEPFNPATNPLGALAASLKTGRVVGTMEKHRSEADALIAKHESGLEAFRSGMRAAVSVDFKLNSRVKGVESALGKLARKPSGYPDVSKLTDLTGAEIVVKSGADAAKALADVQKHYDVTEVEDMISKPRAEGYRAIHTLIKDRDGLVKEVQIMTERQHAWKYWFHDIYKPLTKEKQRALAPVMAEAAEYGKALSDHLARLDAGAQSTAPKCPPAIASTAGCGPSA